MATKLTIVVCIAILLIGVTAISSSAAGLNSIVTSQNYSMEYSRWPASLARLSTSKIQLTVAPGAVRSLNIVDDQTGTYLSDSYLWIGGIVDGDTLVSTGAFAEVTGSGWIGGYNELIALNFPASSRSIYPAHTPGFDTYQVNLNDEKRQNLGFPQWDYFRRIHVPMHIAVSLRVHTKNEFPFKGITLVDFTVLNQGTYDIRDASIGIQFDCDATYEQIYGGWFDDLVGSLRDIHTVYAIDNDGDPGGSTDNPELILPHGVGIRPIYSSKPATDTNFNWWTNTSAPGNIDFSPRLRGTPTDPFRDYNSETYGHPNGDVNRYYLLRHNEWDFDQVMSAVIGRNNPLWNTPPDGVDLNVLAKGADTKGLLSIGPFDLPPDSSLRVIFAIFAADLVHTDWKNSRNIRDGKYEAYYSKLNFSTLRRAANDALSLGQLLVDPTIPPLGFEIERMNADSAWLSWESACFKEVTGYALYLRPARMAELLNSVTVLPTAFDENWDGATRIVVEPNRHSTLVTDLIPGRPYLVALAHVTTTGEGEKTDPMVIGTANQALIPKPPSFENEFLLYLPEDSTITLTWQPSADSSVRYYKIYRTTDSTLAANRLRPFWSDDSSLVPFAPTHKSVTERGEFWYYEIAAYDSVSASRTSFVDHAPDTTMFYWLTAVKYTGFESDYSNVIQAEKSAEVSRDILLVTGTPISDDDYVIDRNVRQQLEDAMGGYVYDVYNWTDTNHNAAGCNSGYCVNWLDFARYKLIIIQDYPSPRILAEGSDPTRRLYRRILESGGTVAYFGTPTGDVRLFVHSQDSLLRYSPTSFESEMMGLDSAILQTWQGQYNVFGAIDTLAGFAGAIPLQSDWPAVHLDDIKSKVRGLFARIFAIDSVLPYTPAFYPQPTTEVLYFYRSGYPTTSRLHGLPCGVTGERVNGRIYAFSFPLWALDDQSGLALVERLMQDVGNSRPNSSPTVSALPSRFSLGQSYPNPFNSSAIISFDLISTLRVSLDIFNVGGARVRTLISDQALPPGVHRIEWDGRNSDGKAVASGIYFYRLRTDFGDATRRMTLLK